MNDIDLIDTNIGAKNETDEKDEDFGVRLASMMPIFGWWRVYPLPIEGGPSGSSL